MAAVLISLFLIQAILAARRPALAVTVVLALLSSYLLRADLYGIPTTILEALVVGAIAGWIFSLLRQGGIRKKFPILIKHPLFAPGLFFLLAGTLAIAASPNLRAALGSWKAYIIEPLFFGLLVADVMREPKNRTLALIGLAVSAATVALPAGLQRFAGFPIPDPWQAELRATGPFEFPNAVGLLLTPIASLLIVWGLGTRDLGLGRRAGAVAAGISASAATLLSKTEAGLVGILAGLLLFGVLWNRKTRMISLAVVLIAAAFIATPAAAPIRDKLLLRDWSGIVRRNMWEETVALLRDRPLVGAGLSGYPTVVAPYHHDPKIEIFQYPHNIILNFWSEVGILGLIAFGWIIVEFFRMINPAHPPPSLRGERLALAAAMVTLLVHGLVDVPYFKNDLSILFWTLAGLASALRPAATLDPGRRLV